jgi:hypothetical protein
VGLATSSVRLDNTLGTDQLSWVLTSEGKTLHNGEVISQLGKKPVEGDTVVSNCVCVTWGLDRTHFCCLAMIVT